MNQIITVNPDKCVGCNACVRTCPAQEANITTKLEDGRFVTTVNPEKCICCGECVRNCQHGARDYIDDTEEFMKYIEKHSVAILVTPAIKSIFPDKWKGILDWFRKKGAKIYDVSYGADICTWAHLRSIEQKKVGNIITQPCAAIVNYIEIYQPDLIKNLSPVHSPISCEATYLKRYINVKEPLAVLSPCIAKKTEFISTGLVDYNVTFNKLSKYFIEHNINIDMNSSEDSFKYNFDDQQGQVGAIYPRPGGLRDNLWLHNPDINITTSEGVHKVYPELDMYALMPEFKHPEVFDVLSCEFGCNIGPASGTRYTVFDVMATMRDLEKSSKKDRKTGFLGKGEDKLFKKFDEELTLSHFLRQYKNKPTTPVPSEAQLDEIFRSMGKITDEQRHYDCHACGYKSCKQMATAIYRGLNIPDNCIIHAKSVLTARHTELTTQHEYLYSMAAKCREFSDHLIHDIDIISNNMRVIEDATSKTEEKAQVVSSLLQNLVTFCSNNSTLDEDALLQLVGILETTRSAFSTLDENLKEANSSSEEINGSVTELTRLLEELNVILHETTSMDKY